MLVESLTIGIIIGVCGLVTWLVKNKFQPEIERDIKVREKKTLKYARDKKKPLKKFTTLLHQHIRHI